MVSVDAGYPRLGQTLIVLPLLASHEEDSLSRLQTKHAPEWG